MCAWATVVGGTWLMGECEVNDIPELDNGGKNHMCEFVQNSHPGFLPSEYGIGVDDDSRLRDGRVSICVRKIAYGRGGVKGQRDSLFEEVPKFWRYEKLARR